MQITNKGDRFADRHIGPSKEALNEMLNTLNIADLDMLIDETIPSDIRMRKELDISEAMSEFEYLNHIKALGEKNIIADNYIGQGYYGTITPSVILRNIFQNPGWYTQYTPYQAEIAQGRLEALLNFQTMVSDLTGMALANASLLDEGTAAAEAMSMFYGLKNKRAKDEPVSKIFVDSGVFDHTVEVLLTRAEPMDIEVVMGDWKEMDLEDQYFAVLLQYPDKHGEIEDFRNFVSKLSDKGIYSIFAADLLSLALITPPGEFGADAVVGLTQRFGVPMGFGGPHAAYFATREDFKRNIPGRIIGVSRDRDDNYALRMALQTREQHIKRDKATSNICTAQALLAIMAGMYAVYHGEEGIKTIAENIHKRTAFLASGLLSLGYDLTSESFFDTISIKCSNDLLTKVKDQASERRINFFYADGEIRISIDETKSDQQVRDLLQMFADIKSGDIAHDFMSENSYIPTSLQRSSAYLTHEIFNQHHSETKMMRYIKSLENKDLSLVHAMIPLGSCTMKLNAASQLIPVSLPEFANIHPFAPSDQTKGYMELIHELEKDLSTITGFAACSLQPNSGAQGEYSGLLTIAAYHKENGEAHRDIALIPSSAHGTNPASAVMTGMKVVVVKCDEKGNIDVDDLRDKADQHSAYLAALMVTYPSTHGVFESRIKEICKIVHDNGGLVYMDGANMNAQVGLTSPGHINADVCHLNLHKTFAIPHGGGGPGMGPICVNEKLKPFLPGHIYADCGGNKAIKAVSAAPYGSASILLISYGYIKMLGAKGLVESTRYAILNANYIKARLEEEYQVLYTGEKGRAAHELIIDVNPYKSLNVTAEDIAKRLIDYGFHAPTLSFPVAGTLMIEPTESESKDELDRFCDAMLEIKKELNEIATGEADKDNNVLSNAPHTLAMLTSDEWKLPYTRSKAAYPLSYLHQNKFWASVRRVDNAYGDRNLICTCPPMEAYEEAEA
ncbi:aminomethyl-transferring glycine dehydrogenase [Portibacter marinus]|uniref:aminomethyl-transferring glycine dehydrogenase n=1 Tax=Portibacter marinus TaxID=2898660 RepID=UPI001F22B97B|nr:aminomethyl-transferring glycine dehydrogenase [Portibacter marinus]